MTYRVLRGFAPEAVRLELIALARTSHHWEAGRQETGYEKLALKDPLTPSLRELTRRSLTELELPEASDRWDRWLLRYGRGSHVPPHVDPPLAPGVIHVRLNLIVLAPPRGGELRLDGRPIALEAGDAVLFRPDACRHEVTPIDEGERLVWSVGCNR